MKIAIIGSGISGLVAAFRLAPHCEVTVFEAGDHVGGHTHTHDIQTESGKYAIDTGFIVFNDWTYPNFIGILNEIGVQWQDTTMSFSVKSELNGWEYNGTSINSLFAQRLNLVNPKFLKMVRDILRFNQDSLGVVDSDHPDHRLTLGQYLSRHGYSQSFKDYYIVPMGAAIWSASHRQMEEFPIEYFVRFFKNHGMLSVSDRPTWRVIKGGSRSYIPRLTDKFADRIHLNTPVVAVKRTAGGADVTFLKNGNSETAHFDQVVFASHADQTFRLINDLSEAERRVLSRFSYQENETLLHTDTSVLPKKKIAWAAWNYLVPKTAKNRVPVTYNMNMLQGITAPETFCVSLNLDEKIDSKKVLKRLVYHHPIYTHGAVQSQSEWSQISGVNRYHYCGAYWGFGFHEDGVKSGLRVAEQILRKS